jgi:hypothetical protein
MTSETNDRYVYALHVEGDETPFYIGAGRRGRIKAHVLEANGKYGTNPAKGAFIRATLEQGKRIIERKLFENLSLYEAISIEEGLIVKWGRLDLGTGPLYNQRDGGSLCGGKNPSPAAIAALLGARWAAPHAREKQAERQRRYFADPLMREKQSQFQLRLCEDPLECEKRSERGRRRYADPAEREKTSQSIRQAYADPSVRANASNAQRRRFADPAERDKQSQIACNLWADPAFREKMREAGKQGHEKRSQAAKLLWDDPAFREKMKEAHEKRSQAAKRQWAVYHAKQREREFEAWCQSLSSKTAGKAKECCEPQSQNSMAQALSGANKTADKGQEARASRQ